ncbi:MAG TPA: hypothetical protein VGN85_00745, partial [Methyloceanibacter sp.]|nr:hypothetical protein [Methyloceanibacter sp.]
LLLPPQGAAATEQAGGKNQAEKGGGQSHGATPGAPKASPEPKTLPGPKAPLSSQRLDPTGHASPQDRPPRAQKPAPAQKSWKPAG